MAADSTEANVVKGDVSVLYENRSEGTLIQMMPGSAGDVQPLNHMNDICFTVGDRNIGANRALLCAHSPHFQAVVGNATETHFIITDDIKPKAFESIVSYCEIGRFSFQNYNRADLTSLVIYANKYRIVGLVKILVSRALSSMNFGTVFTWLEIAVTAKVDELIIAARRLASNWLKAVRREELNMILEHPDDRTLFSWSSELGRRHLYKYKNLVTNICKTTIDLLKEDQFAINDENLFKMILVIAEAECKNKTQFERDDYMYQLFRSIGQERVIRFELMSETFLYYLSARLLSNRLLISDGDANATNNQHYYERELTFHVRIQVADALAKLTHVSPLLSHRYLSYDRGYELESDTDFVVPVKEMYVVPTNFDQCGPFRIEMIAPYRIAKLDFWIGLQNADIDCFQVRVSASQNRKDFVDCVTEDITDNNGTVTYSFARANPAHPYRLISSIRIRAIVASPQVVAERLAGTFDAEGIDISTMAKFEISNISLECG